MEYNLAFFEPVMDFLDSPGGRHIETIYFTADGNYWLNCWEHVGKIYSRLETMPKFNEATQQVQLVTVADEKDLIVEVMDAQELVDMVLAWLDTFNAKLEKTELPKDEKQAEKVIAEMKKEKMNASATLTKPAFTPKPTVKELAKEQAKKIKQTK